MPETIIHTINLQRAFNRKLVVNNLNLNVTEGCIYGFLGPNGAGKTTTIRMLLGLIRPTAGGVQIFGKPLDQHHRELLSTIGTLVETPSFYLHLTGKENLQLIAGMRRLPNAEVQRVLKIVDLEKDGNRLVRHYSLGMRQRLGLAIGLLGNPRLLILDEPTNGLDPAGIHEVRELIRQMPGSQGVTVFVSSHLLNEVEQIATHIAIIQAGELLFQGPTAHLRAQYADQARIIPDRPAFAREVLSRLGWRIRVDEEDANQLAVESNGAPDVALIVQQLVEAGVKVYHASLEQPSLEDIFLKITRCDISTAAQNPIEYERALEAQ